MADTGSSAGGGAVPAVERARSWLGVSLSDVDNDVAGIVEGFFVDAESGAPVWLLLRARRLLRRARIVAVPMRECAGGPGGAWVAHGAAELMAAPPVDPKRPLRREHELAICAHYGIGESVGRAAEVLGRPAGARTALPAP